MSEIERYDFELPRELIAQHPVKHRADARMMVVQREQQTIDHRHVRDLPEFLTASDCLVLNDTRVIPARLVGYRSGTGGRWEGLFLESEGDTIWKVLAKTRGKMAEGESVTLLDLQGRDAMRLELIDRLPDGAWLMRAESDDEDVLHTLQRVGRVPLPHYIRDGEMLPDDRERYQTVFARNAGSVAAPTAGLHFTEELLGCLSNMGCAQATVTLHVGLGTFRPVTSERLAGHQMHEEWGRIDAAAAEIINHRRAAGGRVVAVGSTSVRLLETAAQDGPLGPWSGRTDLFVRPPYEFRAVDAMLTNFHLPRTTLLVLVCCFGGEELIRRAYREAIDQRYRFFSYGDAMLIL